MLKFDPPEGVRRIPTPDQRAWMMLLAADDDAAAVASEAVKLRCEELGWVVWLRDGRRAEWRLTGAGRAVLGMRD